MKAIEKCFPVVLYSAGTLTRGIERCSFKVNFQLSWFLGIWYVNIASNIFAIPSLCLESFTVHHTNLAVLPKSI